MPLLLDLVAALAAGTIAWAIILRHGRPRAAGVEARALPRALTAALVVCVGGGIVLGVLAWLVRSESHLVQIDESVAEWGNRHGTGFSTDALETITFIGAPASAAVLATVLAVVEALRTRDRWIVPFVLVAVGGTGLITRLVKEAIDRARPVLNPVAETLGPSFPSGHSSWSAAFFAVAALLLSRGRPVRVRAVLAGVGAALPVAIAGTRVLLDVHWLSDVLAGLALGWAWVALCAIAFGRRVLAPIGSRPRDVVGG